MKINVISIALLFLFLISCREVESIDCSLVDCAFQTFSITFVDGDGNNLIENGTYTINDIMVSKNGDQLSFNASEDNKILFETAGQQGDNIYEIKLSESRTDVLILDLDRRDSRNECCGPFFDVNNAIYENSSNLVVETDGFITELIVTIQ
ncbi:hypothetical protein [Costertonia aggregata]|uniref:Lipoprotein n=1 Tax=Costertonia aggregata TaxID=343403 RepID=A0A7H9AQH9_9FLAO|nr:hypothetical protein [Costertonia aggregata]QLG45495.1 hypothetical protein HYG79_09100 [Costertonia aggregata]